MCKISSCLDSDKIKSPCCVFVLLFSSSFLGLYTWHICIIVINNHNYTEGIPTLMWWWSLCGQMILRAVLVVAWLLVEPPMPDRSKVMTQTKRDTLVLQVGGWVWGWQPHPIKNIFVEKLLKSETGWKQHRWRSMSKDLQVGTWKILCLYWSVTRNILIQETRI